MGTKTFKDLLMWQKAHAFVLLVYKIIETFPKSEQFGLTSQFRISAVSIAANIAEGCRRGGKALQYGSNQPRRMQILYHSGERFKLY